MYNIHFEKNNFILLYNEFSLFLSIFKESVNQFIFITVLRYLFLRETSITTKKDVREIQNPGINSSAVFYKDHQVWDLNNLKRFLEISTVILEYLVKFLQACMCTFIPEWITKNCFSLISWKIYRWSLDELFNSSTFYEVTKFMMKNPHNVRSGVPSQISDL